MGREKGCERKGKKRGSGPRGRKGKRSICVQQNSDWTFRLLVGVTF